MKDLNSLIQHLYKEYFNNNDPLTIIEKCLFGKKFEMTYIDYIVINSFKKHLPTFEVLALFGDKKIETKINKIKSLIEEYLTYNMSEKKIKGFVKDYDVDLNEIDLLTLKLMTNYMKN